MSLYFFKCLQRLRKLREWERVEVYSDAALRPHGVGSIGFLILSPTTGRVSYAEQVRVAQPTFGEVGTIDYLEAVALRSALQTLLRHLHDETIKLPQNILNIFVDNRPLLYFLDQFLKGAAGIFVEGDPHEDFDEETFRQTITLQHPEYFQVIENIARLLEELARRGVQVVVKYVRSSLNRAHPVVQTALSLQSLSGDL